MAAKKTGISRDLLIHPGETIGDVLTERGITQAELAARTGVSPAFVSSVIAGKKDISASFALALEYALAVPASFWLNLQANYDAELLELNTDQTITGEERVVREELKDVVKFLRTRDVIPAIEHIDDSIISLRRAFNISNLCNLGNLVPSGAFRMASSAAVKPDVLGAWLLLCRFASDDSDITERFDAELMNELISKLKQVMLKEGADIQEEIRRVMAGYGIDFSVMRNFSGAPVHGYISLKSNGVYQMVLTIRGSYADIFWFSLFHEMGHLANGDLGRSANFIDCADGSEQEAAADTFARDHLINPENYDRFIEIGDFRIESIKEFAAGQKVMPFIVIGRLQKEKRLAYGKFEEYKVRYKWAD